MENERVSNLFEELAKTNHYNVNFFNCLLKMILIIFQLSELHVACFKNDIERVKKILHEIDDPNILDDTKVRIF